MPRQYSLQNTPFTLKATKNKSNKHNIRPFADCALQIQFSQEYESRSHHNTVIFAFATALNLYQLIQSLQLYISRSDFFRRHHTQSTSTLAALGNYAFSTNSNPWPLSGDRSVKNLLDTFSAATTAALFAPNDPVPVPMPFTAI